MFSVARPKHFLILLLQKTTQKNSRVFFFLLKIALFFLGCTAWSVSRHFLFASWRRVTMVTCANDELKNILRLAKRNLLITLIEMVLMLRQCCLGRCPLLSVTLLSLLHCILGY